MGPLGKKEYVTSVNDFAAWKAFPDVQNNAFGFSVDPHVRPLLRSCLADPRGHAVDSACACHPAEASCQASLQHACLHL